MYGLYRYPLFLSTFYAHIKKSHCMCVFSACSVSGCPLADKTLKSLMAANAQELK